MKIFSVILLSVLVPMAVHAAETEECVFFNPAFGLCSTHSHNIGFIDGTTKLPANPTKSEEVAQMNEIIALKSTVIAQQLKEQYDALNAVVKRFKTQLEKAVLTSKIEVLTGNAASGNSGGGSSASSNNNGLSTAEDCYAVTDYVGVYDCFSRNLSKISQALDSDLTGARKQLKNDIQAMKDSYDITPSQTSCPDYLGSKNDVKKCVQHLQAKVKAKKRELENQDAQARWGYR